MAQYRPETFEVLAYNLTVKQLVEKLGYPRVRLHLLMAMFSASRSIVFTAHSGCCAGAEGLSV